MGANSNFMCFAEADGGLHDKWVAGVEAAGNIGLGDVGEKLFVRTLKRCQFAGSAEKTDVALRI